MHDVRVEHAGVEVDEAVPLLEAVAPPEVDVLLVVGVVLRDGVVPVAGVEEGVELVADVLVVLVGLVAVLHVCHPLGAGFLHVLVAFLDAGGGVLLEGSESVVEIGSDLVGLAGAVEDVITLLNGVPGETVEETSSELRGCVLGKVTIQLVGVAVVKVGRVVGAKSIHELSEHA